MSLRLVLTQEKSMKFIKHIGLVICMLSLNLGCSSKVLDAQGALTMRPTITYFQLLRHSPFFKDLTGKQLTFVIDNSNEWAVDEGGAISLCDGEGLEKDVYWILLDGQWAVTYSRASYASTNNDSGKWFQTSTLKNAGLPSQMSCKLIMEKSGYVMKITKETMTYMRDNNFNITSHLQIGQQYYEAMVQGRL